MYSASQTEDRASRQKAEQQLSTEKDPLKRLQLLCVARGRQGIQQIGRSFRILDRNNDGRIGPREFEDGLTTFFAWKMDPSEISQLFELIDTDRRGFISYNQFLQKVRPEMKPRRKDLIVRAFQTMDRSNDGKFTAEDMKGRYNVKKHPKYQNGEWTEDQVFKEFLKNFEDKDKIDGVVTQDEFINYYTGVSASIDDDRHFEFMMTNSYNLSSN